MKQKKQFVAPAVTIMNMQVETSILAGSGVTPGSDATVNGRTINLIQLGDWN